MSNQKHHELMKNLDRCYDAVLLTSTKGTSAAEISKKIGMHKTMVHRNLNILELLGKVEDDNGIWRAKAGKQTIQPLEKKIIIQLPLSKDQAREEAELEADAKKFESLGYNPILEYIDILLEKLKETRTIRITGKNVDDLDPEKLAKLIQQANEKSSKVNLKGLSKSLKKSHNNNSKE